MKLVLGEIKVPTLVLVGTKDFVCSKKWANVLHDGIHDSQLVVFEKSGHMAHLEEPQSHAHAIAEFLAPLPR